MSNSSVPSPQAAVVPPWVGNTSRRAFLADGLRPAVHTKAERSRGVA